MDEGRSETGSSATEREGTDGETLRLHKALLSKIVEHAKQSFPKECCGFLIGVRNETKDVLEVVASRNLASTSRARRYTVDSMEFVRIEKELEGSRREVLGFYHSHPDAPAKPSLYDLDHAWPVYSYLIISLSSGKPYDFASWALAGEGGRFREENLLVVA